MEAQMRNANLSSLGRDRLTFRSISRLGMMEILAGINQGNADAGIFTSPTTLKAEHAGLKELVNVTK
jgi:hypothetical protein